MTIKSHNLYKDILISPFYPSDCPNGSGFLHNLGSLGNLNVIFLFCREINGEKKNFCLVTNPRKKLKYSMFSEAES